MAEEVRKLGAPKPEESFDELFNCARVVERREQQYKEAGERKGRDIWFRQTRQHPSLVKTRQVILAYPMSKEGVVRGMVFNVMLATGMDTLLNIARIGLGLGVQRHQGSPKGIIPYPTVLVTCP